MEPEREGPTLAELLDFASRLPEPQARELLAQARPAPLAPEPDDLSARPPPIYRGW